MKTAKLESIFAVILATSSLGARGGCGPCPDQHEAFPLLPQANGDSSTPVDVPKDAGALTRDECMKLCDASDVISCTVEEPGGAPTVSCVRPSYCGAGRRPAGFRVRKDKGGGGGVGVGAWLAGVARLEAASVDAFDRLERELAAHGAPERLVARARASSRDEVRHARMVAALAERHGSRARSHEGARTRRKGVRSLVAVARDNAVEGCVREAFGALLATWQARAARGAGARAVFARIARDETRHAALSWSVAAWAEQRMSSSERARVRRAIDQAWRALDAELASAPPAAIVAEGLLPPPALARQWLGALRRALL